ncbi:MAG: sugar phosphate isomerase/epimerase [Planctomycetes bacterium]|nr:sugar phosphate isomerase/epimerase [Planctomycetota bacterium]
MAFRFTGFADEAGKTLDEQIAVTRELGWNAIEVRQCGGKHFCDLTDPEFESAWEKLQKAGVGIASFGSQIANWARPIRTDFQIDVLELQRNIPRMLRTGTRFIRCMSYPNDKPPRPVGEWKKEVFRRMKELARIASGGGVILAHENCNGYGGEGPGQCLELLEAVENTAFRLIFDTGNKPHGGGSLWDFYQKVRDHVVHIHVKATRTVDGKEQTCYPDEDGESVPARVFDDLKGRGYDGWISIEPHLSAQIHAGKQVDNVRAAAAIYIEYGRRIMRMAR